VTRGEQGVKKWEADISKELNFTRNPNPPAPNSQNDSAPLDAIRQLNGRTPAP